MASGGIARRIFQGVVPVRFTLPDEKFPLCFNAPRCLSLGSFAHRSLASFISDPCTNLWFSHGEDPLKWQLPLGVIYDSLNPHPDVCPSIQIEVRLAVFPGTKLIRCESPATAQSFFCHSFKESLFVTDGDMQLLTHDAGIHQRIEAAVVQNDFPTFQSLFQRRLERIDSWRMWPIKFVKYEGQELKVMQCLLAVEGNEQTLETALAAKGITASRLIIHGLTIAATVRLRDVLGVMIYPDGFLYAVVVTD
jgi:hypothetical protein